MDRRTFAKLFGGAAAIGLGGMRRSRAAEEVTVYPRVETESWDGTTLVSSLYVPGARHSPPRPAIVLAHGYGFTREDMDETARFFANEGYVALVPDARGFGDSGGESTTNGPSEVADVLVHVDRLADGTFHLPEGETVDVDVRPGSNGPAVGMTGSSYGGAIQLLTAAATPEWFRNADDVALSSLRAATPNLDLESSPLDAITPYISWQDLARGVAPNGVVKAVWNALLLGVGTEGYERDDGPTPEGQDPNLYRFAAEAAATNELSDEAEAYFETRSPDLAAIADNGVPTLIVQQWSDSLFPPTHGIRAFRGIRNAPSRTPVALTLSPLEAQDSSPLEGQGHNSRPPWESGPAGPALEYVYEISTAWHDRHVVGDTSRWARNGFPTVSVYQKQYPDVPDEHHDETWPGWRGQETFPPADATRTTLDLAAATNTDRTVIGNSVAPSSIRGAGGRYTEPTADAPAGTTAAFDFAATTDVDVTTAPSLTLSVTPLGTDTFVFAKVALVDAGTGEANVIDSQVAPYRIRETAGERTSVTVDLVPFQRYLSADDRLRLLLATTDNGYVTARESAGLIVHHANTDDSALLLEAISESDAPFEGAPATPAR